jgi:type II secretory pathway component HofQ
LYLGLVVTFSGWPTMADQVEMEAMHIPVQQMFMRLATAAHVNLVMQGDLQAPVHVRLQQLPAREALHMLCQSVAANCYWHASNHPQSSRLHDWQEADSLLVTAQQAVVVDNLQFVTVPLRFAEAEPIAQQLRADASLLAGGQLVADRRSQSLFLRVPASQIEPLLAVINSLDKPLQQVHIEARIAIATSDVGSSLRQGLGLQLGNHIMAPEVATQLNMSGTDGLSSLQMGLVASHILLNLELAAMEASGQVLTLAQPQVVVQEGQQGLIETGQEVPYVMQHDGSQSRQWKQAVLGLTVTPRVLPDQQVELDLSVVQDSVGELLANGELALNTHRLRTKVRLGVGQTLVLGGALYEQQLQRLLHNPAWMSLPVLGSWLNERAQQFQRFELLVFVTPRVVNL